ncbi:MAG: TRAP transporter small permease subunit [Saccharospirillum sp.]|nr:TRAP transporter small permease subunit [Saccharospirillum sp.]
MKVIADLIDKLNLMIGDALKWAMPIVVFVCALVAVLRYGFGVGYPWLSEIYVWLNGAAFMLAAPYLLCVDKHVRVDFLYGKLSKGGQAIVNIVGTVVLLWPMLYVIAIKSLPGISRSWRVLEQSPTLGGLPFMYLLKSCLLAFCILLALQGLSLVIRSIITLRNPTTEEQSHG